MDFNVYDKLLIEVSEIYKRIPIKEKTFMDISGYSHYENVCSNILAFYFNTVDEHKFNNFVTNAFIKVLKNKNIDIDLLKEDDIVKVSREYITLKGNRIDIVLENNKFIIGIENKIEASIYNDLKDYADTLNKLNKNSIKILLSLHDNSNIINQSEFINITYQEFLNQLKIDLIDFQDKSNKWLIFLNEFIKSFDNFKGEIKMEEEILNWLKLNKDKIDELDKIREIANKSIEKREEELKKLLENKFNANFIKIWKGKNEMTCYIDAQKKYHVDANLTPEGWKIGLFSWITNKNNEIQQIIRNSKYNLIEDDGRHRILFLYDFNTSIDIIVDKVIEIYEYVENILEE